MNPIQNAHGEDSVSGAPLIFEDTLRLVAHVPVPEALAERVQAGLRAVPHLAQPSARVLAWPDALKPGSNWMRAAAAAAIAFVVIGGGWGVYSRVQPEPQAKTIAMPPHVGAPGPSSGGFSSAGAMRTPQTLNGPVLTHPVSQVQPAGLIGKPPVRVIQKPVHRRESAAVGKATVGVK